MWFFLLGLGSWILLEYVMHRFVLHDKAPSSHTPHHLNPKDKTQIFAEPTTVALLSVSVCFIGLLLFSGISVFFLYLGLVTGYLLYEFIHYRIHHGKARTPWMKYLRKHHLQHHFADDKTNYSVVFPPIDRLFRSKFRPHR